MIIIWNKHSICIIYLGYEVDTVRNSLSVTDLNFFVVFQICQL